jgi:hypothetical protein
VKPGASRELNVSSGASRPLPGPIQPVARPSPAFAHASEAEFARILDFYAVRWEYEPHTFPILWNLDGAVVESFSPDFWLPDLETYVELTTLKQSLVRKKNRKLRRLRELYPDVRIKLFYGRDFRALMLKYGKLGLIDEMSGTLGQSTPTGRAVALLAAAAAAEPADLVVAAEAMEASLATTDHAEPADGAEPAGEASDITSMPTGAEPAAAHAEANGAQGSAISTPRRRRRHRRRHAGDRSAGPGMIGRDRRAAGDR